MIRNNDDWIVVIRWKVDAYMPARTEWQNRFTFKVAQVLKEELGVNAKITLSTQGQTLTYKKGVPARRSRNAVAAVSQMYPHADVYETHCRTTTMRHLE